MKLKKVWKKALELDLFPPQIVRILSGPEIVLVKTLNYESVRAYSGTACIGADKFIFCTGKNFEFHLRLLRIIL